MFAENHSDMGKSLYWNKFYSKKLKQNNESFEWFINYSTVKDKILQLIQDKSPLVLDLGCGMSVFCHDFLRDLMEKSYSPTGFLVDISSPALEWSRGKRFGFTYPVTVFLKCDAEYLPFRDECFSIVFDKGTVDAILKDKLHGQERSIRVISEAIRVIKDGGHLVQLTDETPELRLTLLEKVQRNLNGVDIRLNFQTVEDMDNQYFMYTLHKNPFRK